jgi:transcription elongation GreA/GreB family factor
VNKQHLIEKIVVHLEKELLALKEAALATYEAATNEESKPENEYDTRGLEASYLAGAQAKRVADIEELIYIYKDLKVRQFQPDEAISSTALVEVSLNERKSWVFIMSKGGGTTLTVDGISVQIVTPSSPLGEALLGLKAGDTAIVETGDKTREYDILSIQ